VGIRTVVRARVHERQQRRIQGALRLPRPGVVHVRLALPNGNYAVKTIDVT
jgi:hypothetical protein